MTSADASSVWMPKLINTYSLNWSCWKTKTCFADFDGFHRLFEVRFEKQQTFGAWLLMSDFVNKVKNSSIDLLTSNLKGQF